MGVTVIRYTLSDFTSWSRVTVCQIPISVPEHKADNVLPGIGGDLGVLIDPDIDFDAVCEKA